MLCSQGWLWALDPSFRFPGAGINSHVLEMSDQYEQFVPEVFKVKWEDEYSHKEPEWNVTMLHVKTDKVLYGLKKDVEWNRALAGNISNDVL